MKLLHFIYFALVIMLLPTTSITAQDLSNIDLSSVNLSDVQLDSEIIDDNALESFSGTFVNKNGQLVFVPKDCTLNKNGVLLKSLKRKKIKTKKWLKRVKKADNKELKHIVIKGIKSKTHPVVFVKKIVKPLKKVKYWSGKSTSSHLYLMAAQDLYNKTINLREKYNLFSVAIQEVDDATLGKVTEYTLFDSKCNKISPNQIKQISDKELNGLNNTLKIGGGLILKQTALTGLAALSTKSIASAGYLDKVLMGKDALTAGVFQTAIIGQLPKIMKNLKASKAYIEQLKAE